MTPIRFVSVLLATLVAACAATDPHQPGTTTTRAEPEYRTGSNIPVRPQRQSTQEERDRTAAPANELRRGANTGRPD